MKKTFLILSIGLFFGSAAWAESKCFLAKEHNSVIKQQGDCEIQHSPCSTFKIAISLMGYDKGILQDETHPELAFKKGYPDDIDRWKEPHNPRLWMKNSCVWYSQVLTRKLGMNEFKNHVKNFHYGNQDLSGDKGKNNGLTNSWLSSSLEISPKEQITFLQKLIDNKFPVSHKAHEMTRNIIFVEELPHGWKLYGKTGSGVLLSADRTQKLDIMHGWFVGWIQKNGRSIVFANHITDDQKQDTYTGPRAKAETKEKLVNLIDELENDSRVKGVTNPNF